MRTTLLFILWALATLLIGTTSYDEGLRAGRIKAKAIIEAELERERTMADAREPEDVWKIDGGTVVSAYVALTDSTGASTRVKVWPLPRRATGPR